MSPQPTLVKGRTDEPLYLKPLGTLLKEQAAAHGDKTALVSSWQQHRASFHDLDKKSKTVAGALLDLNVRRGQHVGIFAGNRYEYIDVFLGGSRIGRPTVVMNSLFSPSELCNAVLRSECVAIFIAPKIGDRDNSKHIEALGETLRKGEGSLQNVVIFGSSCPDMDGFETYNSFLQRENSIFVRESDLRREEKAVKAEDVLNLQFTSGTTGLPKMAMLTHINMINNGRLNGVTMKLTSKDVVCCPPPLFHCFGLTMGFLNALVHGASIVFAGDAFDPEKVVTSLVDEKCTALLGVPTMILGILESIKKRGVSVTTVRTGLAAGSAVPKSLMDRIKNELSCDGMIIAYGMTETSPVTFMTAMDDPDHLRITSLGRIMPHSAAKIVDEQGNIVPRGERGELCTSGYALQKGYYKNKEKTDEAMRRDEDGVLWMHTGDECIIDEEGYCFISGRLKDIIIRGGENIYPREIEERVLEHEDIGEASIAAIKDEKYGEVVGAFLRANSKRPSDKEIQDFVREALGRHKAPQYIFWIGDEGVGDDFPKTASGKHQKHILSDIGLRLVEQRAPKAKL